MQTTPHGDLTSTIIQTGAWVTAAGALALFIKLSVWPFLVDQVKQAQTQVERAQSQVEKAQEQLRIQAVEFLDALRRRDEEFNRLISQQRRASPTHRSKPK